MTVAATVREAARRFGDRAAVVAAEGWSLSFDELDRRSDEVAAGLAADHGIGDEDLVALVLPSSPDYLVAYAALAKVGAVTAGVNPRYAPPERAAVLAVADPKLVITTTDLAVDALGGRDGRSAARSTAEQVDREAAEGGSRTVVIVEPATGPADVLSTLAHPGAVPPPIDDTDPDRLVAVVFTSGTTGTPRGAVFANRELAAVTAADLGDRAEEWGGGGAMLASTELAHVGAMTKWPTWLRLGASVHLLARWRAADVLRTVAESHMTTVGGVAPQVALMLRHPDFDRFDLSSVRAIVMGGAASSPDLVREARRRFHAAYSIRYSSTESGGIGLGTAFDADDDEALHSVGRARGEVEVRVRDEDGRPLPAGEVGELELRSPTMMRGYWRDPEATAAALVDGWLRTGDLARIDEGGLVRLAGRRKEMFIRGGYNVYPMEVEAVLNDHPAVAEIAVVARPDPVMGEIGVAVVVPVDAPSPPSLAELRSFGRDRLAAHKLPEAVRVVEELPRTAMSKIDRQALTADQHQDPPLVAPSTAPVCGARLDP